MVVENKDRSVITLLPYRATEFNAINQGQSLIEEQQGRVGSGPVASDVLENPGDRSDSGQAV